MRKTFISISDVTVILNTLISSLFTSSLKFIYLSLLFEKYDNIKSKDGKHEFFALSLVSCSNDQSREISLFPTKNSHPYKVSFSLICPELIINLPKTIKKFVVKKIKQWKKTAIIGKTSKLFKIKVTQDRNRKDH